MGLIQVSLLDRDHRATASTGCLALIASQSKNFQNFGNIVELRIDFWLEKTVRMMPYLGHLR